MAETIAVILAAGVGSRLRPLTDDCPKCLMDLGSESMLLRALRVLALDGIRRAVVVTGYKHEQVVAAVRHAPCEVTVVENVRYADTQNMLSLALALDVIPAGNAVVKLDGDVVFGRGLVASLMRPDEGCSVAVQPSDTLGAEEMKVMLDEGRITRFGKGLDPRRAFGESIGIEWFSSQAVKPVGVALRRAIDQGRTDLYYEDVYNDLVDQIRMEAVGVPPENWTEVDDLVDLERARMLVASRQFQ